MTIAPSAALVLPATLRLTPEQFALVCEANPEAVLELAADGQLIRMTPTGGDTGRRNTRLLTRLQTWAHRQGGWDVFDSSTGFRLADGSVLSPDASMVRLVRWQVLSAEQRRGAAAQAGRLPGQRCPAGLAAVSREAGGGDPGRSPSAWRTPRCWTARRCCRGCGWSWRRSERCDCRPANMDPCI
jgi:hypothetical protein